MDDSLRVTFEDLSARFFLNLPASEFERWERVFYQLEQAHWYYEDFLRLENDALPKLKLRDFCKYCFELCPVLTPYVKNFEQLFVKFQEYLFSVPVCGSVLLNSSGTKCLLVKGYGSKSWGFPKGKINQGESDVDCAIRETLEEVGFDCSDLIQSDYFLQGHGKEIKLFIIFDVPEDYPFQTKTRREISGIKWFEIERLLQDKPANQKDNAKFWNVRPFIPGLKKLLSAQKKKKSRSSSVTRIAKKNVRSKNKNIPKPAGYEPDAESTNTAFGDEAKGWSIEEMYSVNEQRFGVKSTFITDVNDLASSMAQAGYHYKNLRNQNLDVLSSSGGSDIRGGQYLAIDNFLSHDEDDDEDFTFDDEIPAFQFDMDAIMGAMTKVLNS